MPAIAYNCKGPKDIILHDECGYLVSDIEQMSDHIIRYFSSEPKRAQMMQKATLRAKDYQAESIMLRFIQDMGLDEFQYEAEQRSVA